MSELGSLLDEAKKTITGERQDQYGAPEDSFDRIARYWSVYLARSISSLDVAHLMALMKLARAQGQGFKRDNYLDLAGYAAIAADRLAPQGALADTATPARSREREAEWRNSIADDVGRGCL